MSTNDIVLLMNDEFGDNEINNELGDNEDIPHFNYNEKLLWFFKRFKSHFVNQFIPRKILESIKLHPYLLSSFIVVIIIGAFLIKNGIPSNNFKNIFSLWTLVTIGHLIQAMAGLCLPGEPLIKRVLKIPFHLILTICGFLYWLKMGEWMHYGFHHFLYASFILYYTFERLGKSAAFVIGLPLAISDIVGYGEFPIFAHSTGSSGLDDILKERPWVFLIPTGILFLCELLIEGPLFQTILDFKNMNRTERTELL